MNYRKKPVVIEAMQYSASELQSILRWVQDDCSIQDDGALIIHTVEGNMRADLGDWIIKGVKGEFYPCKTDIFEATYELVTGVARLDG